MTTRVIQPIGRRPVVPGINKFADDSALINTSLNSLMWLSPLANHNFGKMEPPAQYKREGLLTFSNGVDWNPVGTNQPTWVWWDAVNSQWVALAGGATSGGYAHSLGLISPDGTHWDVTMLNDGSIETANLGVSGSYSNSVGLISANGNHWDVSIDNGGRLVVSG